MIARPCLIVCLCTAWLPLRPTHAAEPSPIRSDERVVFFPTAARLGDDGRRWLVPIHAWVFEPEESDPLRGGFLDDLRERLLIEPGSDRDRVMRDRLGRFLVD